MIPLPFPTADNAVITADSIFLVTDGANLIGGGGTAIHEAPNKGSFNKLSVTTSDPIPVYGFGW